MSIHPTSDGSVSAGVPAARRSVIPYSHDRVSLAAGLVAAFALAIYLRTMLPGVGFWDTAEAQTVPHTLSIFHPTGFPTYTLIGWLWSQLPIGDVAYRMNLMSGVSIALAAALTVLIAAHLIPDRHRNLQAASAAIGGLSFAFASEPWQNALRADVHAPHVFLAAIVIWLLFCWGAAERAASPRAARWLGAAALVFGIGMGNHALMGLLSFGIVVWLIAVDASLWRRWRLVAACAALLLAGLSVYLYIPIRAAIDPEPPLFYARPDNLERLRYLIFAEQFSGLFRDFHTPFADIDLKWSKAAEVLGAQYPPPGWLLVAVGLVVVGLRSLGAALFLLVVAVVIVFYSMNFNDGDIDRYYMTAVLVTAPLLAVAVATIADTCGRAAWLLARRSIARDGRRRLAIAVTSAVTLAAAGLPIYGLATLYEELDRSDNREASLWVQSVYDALPPNAVVVSWWSYSTPLWYHRWVLGERPDVTIIDDRNILDDGYGNVFRAIDAFLGERPVYAVRNFDVEALRRRYETETVETYGGYTMLLEIKERSR